MKAGNISHSDSAPIATAKIDQFNYISNTSSEGFLEMLKMFRKKDLDPSGEMAKRDFYPKPDHTPVDIVHQIHWGPIEVQSSNIIVPYLIDSVIITLSSRNVSS